MRSKFICAQGCFSGPVKLNLLCTFNLGGLGDTENGAKTHFNKCYMKIFAIINGTHHHPTHVTTISKSCKNCHKNFIC